MVCMTWDGTDNQGSDANGAVLVGFSGGPPAERARQRWAREKDAAYAEALNEIYPDFSKNFVRRALWIGRARCGPAPAIPFPRRGR